MYLSSRSSMQENIMGNYYHEKLPVELARTIMAEEYNEKYIYYLITDGDGSYITAYDSETNEHIGLMKTTDGSVDDYELDVDEFKFIEDELFEIDEVSDYTRHGFRYICFFVILSEIIGFAAIIGTVVYFNPF